MKNACFVLLAAALAGCAATPTTRQAYLDYNKKGGFGALTVENTVDRSYDKVVADINKKFAECFSYFRSGVEHTGWGYKRTGAYYQGFGRSISPAKTEYTFRMATQPPTGPDDGHFRSATDVERLGLNKTKVTTYTTYLWGFRAIADSVQAWSEGKTAACPNVM